MIVVLMFLVGLVFGSFVNALVWRVKEQEGKKKPSKQLSILKGRSMCPKCKHQLAGRDLLPVVSWLSLRGKCRYCKKPISIQYPLVELATGLVFALSYLTWGDLTGAALLQFVVWLVLLVGLMALFIYDLKWMILPNRILLPMIYLAVVYVVVNAVLYGDVTDIRQALLGVVFGAGIFWALYELSRGQWIGGGDVKLGILMGLMLGPQLALLAIFLASLVGSVVSIVLMASKKLNRKQQVPFGPYLILGFYIAMLWGQQIVDWYHDAVFLNV